LGVIGDGTVVLLLHAIATAPIVEGRRIMGIEADRLIGIRDPAIVIAPQDVGEAAIVVGPG
jgi:hypothetical protein